MKTIKLNLMILLGILATGSAALGNRSDVQPKMNGKLKVTTLSPEEIRYTGKPYNKELGAYVFNARNYSPEMSRWSTPDPSGFPDGANNQIYPFSPLSIIDVQGLEWYNPLSWNWNRMGEAIQVHLGVGPGIKAVFKISKLKLTAGAQASIGSFTDLSGNTGSYITGSLDLPGIVAGSYVFGLTSDYEMHLYTDTMHPIDEHTEPLAFRFERASDITAKSSSKDWFKLELSGDIFLIDTGVTINFQELFWGVVE